MLSSFMTACYNIEFYASELCRRVLRPRVVILSVIHANYIVKFYDGGPGCRVSWPRAKNDESARHVIKCRVCWPRAKNDESVGHVLKCRGSFNDYNHNIHASNSAFLNHYHLQGKNIFCPNYPQSKHAHAYERKPSILVLLCPRNEIFLLLTAPFFYQFTLKKPRAPQMGPNALNTKLSESTSYRP